MTGTVYGKIDCLSNTGVLERNGSEIWKNFWDFMLTLESVSYVTRIAHHSGTNAISGANGYWDDPSPFCPGAFGVWRWNSHAARPFDWYMYAQVVSASNDPAAQSQCSPSLVNGSTMATRGVILSAAATWVNTSSFSPWSGSTSMGSATKGTQCWASGAAGRRMVVFPRSNSTGGSHVTLTQNNVSGLAATSTLQFRYHFLADRDGILMLGDSSSDGTYDNLSYTGCYKLRNSLTSSGICSGSYGMIQIATPTAQNNTIETATAIGDTLGTTGQNGGVCVGVPSAFNTISGMAYTDGSNLITHQPNTFNNNTIDEMTYTVVVSETPNFGVAGYIDTPLIRQSIDCGSNDINTDGTRAWFGGTVATTQYKISTVWSGSIAPGVGTSRTGSNIVVTNP